MFNLKNMKEIIKKIEVGKDHIIAFVLPEVKEGELVELTVKSINQNENGEKTREENMEVIKKGCNSISIKDPIQWQKEERKDRKLI